ncbi:MAG: bifunctional 5,10-methylenetetrahydrofolate dehydrogenase/5,10-methenyltetrahydrofolate cyclohydrolase [Candidatus Marinimicrobia bacterium]|nr:bifunctional 5,10-methylenetetrahydrofolate dehydrogenase/5,10-methenyltetrahydrofolate cyclohydrolase [Candidatus Neomarinimicrobiota bacterium]
MDTLLLKGKPVAEHIRQELTERIQGLKADGITPNLAAIIVGGDPASKVYVKNKARAFEKMDCDSRTYHLDKNASENEVLDLIHELNQNMEVHGILVQLPLPRHLDSKKILHTVSPQKDVDGFHPENLGLLLEGNPKFIPCTPHGILEILKYYNIPVSGRHAVIVGRSNIVGKPMFALLAQKFEMGNATVTICHTGTKDLDMHTKQADIIIAAAGSPKMIRGDMVKKGVDIIDVGINRIENDSEKGYALVGDVDTDSVMGIARSVTPVPGGVGPMTITMLLVNTVIAAENMKEFAVISH